MKAMPPTLEPAAIGQDRAIYAEMFAADPRAARRAAILSAEAADVFGELFGERVVSMHMVLMTCLRCAASVGDALARRPDPSLADIRRTVRSIERMLQSAARAQKVTQEQIALLAEVRSGVRPRRPRTRRSVAH
jgi:hypothetical protein